MQNKVFTFSVFNKYAEDGISEGLNNFISSDFKPIFVCVGSDLVLGDSLGPLCGTVLKRKMLGTYVYGTLNQPVTAKEIKYVKEYLKQMHPNSVIVAIDAAVGEEEDVGLIRIVDKGLKPGLGVEKDLGEIGDVSIIGVVAAKSGSNFNLFNLTRLNLVYKMAEKIAEGIHLYIERRKTPLSFFGA